MKKKIKEENLLKNFDSTLSKISKPIIEKVIIEPPMAKNVIIQKPLVEADNLISQAVSAINIPVDAKKTEFDLINSFTCKSSILYHTRFWFCDRKLGIIKV
jgi:hypothetical protein